MSKPDNAGRTVTADNLLTDGSFESAQVRDKSWTSFEKVGGWRSDTGVEVWGKDFNVGASDGSKVMELDFDSRFSRVWQDVKTEKGEQYTFSFDVAQRPGTAAATNTIEVWWNGVRVGVVTPGTTAWEQATFKVTGTGANDRIEFREEAGDNDSFGGLIDNVSLRSTSALQAIADAEKEAAAAKEKAEKEAAAAKEKAEKEAAAAKEKAEKEAAAAKEKAEKEAAAAKEKAEKEAADKAAAEKAAADKAAADKAAADKAAADEAKAKATHDNDHNGNGRDHSDLIVGTSRSDTLSGDQHANVMYGKGSDDRMSGGKGNDLMLGGGGDDVMLGGKGHDQMFGGSRLEGEVDLAKFRIQESVVSKVTFESESAGFKSTLGMYKIAADGTIGSVDILFANASAKGSGGTLTAGHSQDVVKLEAGDRLGFFIVPNGFQNSAKLVSDENGRFMLLGKDGNPATIADTDPILVHVGKDGTMQKVSSQYGTTFFHSLDELNADGFEHVKGHVDVAAGRVTLSFEDLMGGGDKDYNDLVVSIDIGRINAALLPKPDSVAKEGDDDLMLGGAGHDDMFGMSGVDTLEGGAGNDRMWGNSGDDLLKGGAGHDEINGGTGNDTIHDGNGHDVVRGNSGDDLVVAGEGNDVFEGNSGFDTLDFSGSRGAMTIDVSKGTATGMGNDKLSGFEKVIGSSHNDAMLGSSRADELVGGAGADIIRGLGGADTLTGGNGADTFVWQAKDLGAGVDIVTDYSAADRDVLDLSKVIPGRPSSVGDTVRLTERADGTLLSVKQGDAYIDVALLAGAHNLDAATLAKDGLLLL